MPSSPTTVVDLKTWKGAKSVCFPTATETIKKLKLKNLGQVSGDHAVKWSLVWDFCYSGSPVIFLILHSQSPTRVRWGRRGWGRCLFTVVDCWHDLPLSDTLSLSSAWIANPVVWMRNCTGRKETTDDSLQRTVSRNRPHRSWIRGLYMAKLGRSHFIAETSRATHSYMYTGNSKSLRYLWSVFYIFVPVCNGKFLCCVRNYNVVFWKPHYQVARYFINF